jgi:hypothetical protein
MIVHRFMSDLEYQRLMDGETLTNTTVHAAEGRKSRSVGFCFFTESPEEAIHWLSFNVSTDWCVTFDIPDNLLQKSRARYRDPEKDTLLAHASIWRTEWCIQKYSIHTVRVISATDQWAKYTEDLKKELVNMLGPLGQLLLMTI